MENIPLSLNSFGSSLLAFILRAEEVLGAVTSDLEPGFGPFNVVGGLFSSWTGWAGPIPLTGGGLLPKGLRKGGIENGACYR